MDDEGPSRPCATCAVSAAFRRKRGAEWCAGLLAAHWGRPVRVERCGRCGAWRAVWD